MEKKNSFQTNMNTRSPVDMMPCRHNGRMIPKNERMGDEPSISELSRISRGTSSRYERVIHMTIGMLIPVWTRTMPPSVSSSPVNLNRRNTGTIPATGGSRVVERNQKKRFVEFFNLPKTITYAAGTPNRRQPETDASAMNAELRM